MENRYALSEQNQVGRFLISYFREIESPNLPKQSYIIANPGNIIRMKRNYKGDNPMQYIVLFAAFFLFVMLVLLISSIYKYIKAFFKVSWKVFKIVAKILIVAIIAVIGLYLLSKPLFFPLLMIVLIAYAVVEIRKFREII